MEDRAEQISAEVLRRLSLLRIQSGLTHQELADRTGLNRSYIGLLEKGKRRPTMEVTLRLSLALGQDLAKLLINAQVKLETEAITPASRGKEPERLVKIGGAIRRMRRMAGLSQDQLAERTGLTAIHISQIERDGISPTLDDLHALCRALGVKPLDLLASIR